jgi:hypothetical protein
VKYEIEADVPEGWEPFAWRFPRSGEHFLSLGCEVVLAEGQTFYSPRLILRRTGRWVDATPELLMERPRRRVQVSVGGVIWYEVSGIEYMSFTDEGILYHATNELGPGSSVVYGSLAIRKPLYNGVAVHPLETEVKILRMIDEGLGDKEICKNVGVSAVVVRRFRKQGFITVRHTRASSPERCPECGGMYTTHVCLPCFVREWN